MSSYLWGSPGAVVSTRMHLQSRGLLAHVPDVNLGLEYTKQHDDLLQLGRGRCLDPLELAPDEGDHQSSLVALIWTIP